MNYEKLLLEQAKFNYEMMLNDIDSVIRKGNFFWKDKMIINEDEYILLCKTRLRLIGELEQIKKGIQNAS